jgi:hypothetical protein
LTWDAVGAASATFELLYREWCALTPLVTRGKNAKFTHLL